MTDSPLPAPLPWLLLPAHHSMLRDVMSQEKFRRTAPLLDPPMFPDLRIEGQGRIVELDLSLTAPVAAVLALAPLTVRGRERRRWSSSRSLSSRERSRSSDCSRSRRVRSRSRGDRSRSSDRYRDLFRRDWSRSSDRYRSRRQRTCSPACRETRCHAIFLVVLSTARGLVDDHLPPLTVRCQRREDGEPDVSSRRVWRR